MQQRPYEVTITITGWTEVKDLVSVEVEAMAATIADRLQEETGLLTQATVKISQQGRAK